MIDTEGGNDGNIHSLGVIHGKPDSDRYVADMEGYKKMRVIIDISDDAYKRISDVNTELSYEDIQLVKYAICLGESLYDYEKRKSVPDNSGWSLPKNFHEMSEERQRAYLGIFG